MVYLEIQSLGYVHQHVPTIPLRLFIKAQPITLVFPAALNISILIQRVIIVGPPVILHILQTVPHKFVYLCVPVLHLYMEIRIQTNVYNNAETQLYLLKIH